MLFFILFIHLFKWVGDVKNVYFFKHKFYPSLPVQMDEKITWTTIITQLHNNPHLTAVLYNGRSFSYSYQLSFIIIMKFEHASQ